MYIQLCNDANDTNLNWITVWYGNCTVSDQKTHPSHGLFTLLPSGRRYRSLRCHTSRLRNSLFPSAFSLLNSKFKFWTLSYSAQLLLFTIKLNNLIDIFYTFSYIYIQIHNRELFDGIKIYFNTTKNYYFNTANNNCNDNLHFLYCCSNMAVSLCWLDFRNKTW